MPSWSSYVWRSFTRWTLKLFLNSFLNGSVCSRCGSSTTLCYRFRTPAKRSTKKRSINWSSSGSGSCFAEKWTSATTCVFLLSLRRRRTCGSLPVDMWTFRARTRIRSKRWLRSLLRARSPFWVLRFIPVSTTGFANSWRGREERMVSWEARSKAFSF